MNKDQSSVKKISKKEAQKIVFNKISDALSEYKKDVKEKKFNSKIKKASKLFAADIAKVTSRHNGQTKKVSKKNPQKESASAAS
jgi:hypothetical protein